METTFGERRKLVRLGPHGEEAPSSWVLPSELPLHVTSLAGMAGKSLNAPTNQNASMGETKFLAPEF